MRSRVTRRILLVALAVTVAWGAAAAALLRQLETRQAGERARAAARAETLLDETRGQLEREARLLAADPAVVEGTTRGDWGTLARGASPRMVGLTIEHLADLLVIVDARGDPLVQVPAGARLPAVETALPAPALQVVNGRTYIVASAPVRAPDADAPVGWVLAGRGVESLGPALGREPPRTALVALAGARTIASTLPGVLPTADAIARGPVLVAGERWIARPVARAGDLALVALVSESDRLAQRARLMAWLAGALVLTLGAVAATARSARAPVPPAASAAAHSEERMAAVADLGRLLSETLDPDVVGQRIVDSVRRLLDVHSAALLRLLPESGDLVVMSVADAGPTFLPGVIFPRGMGTSGFVARTRQPVITADLLTDPRFSFTPELRTRIEHAGYRSVLTLPLLVRDTVIGVLSVGDVAGRVFDDEEIGLARAFADQAALAFENARLFAEGVRRQREAEEMARVARTLTESLDVQAVGDRIVESVLPLFGADLSGLRILEADGSLVLVAVGGRARGHFDSRDVQARGEGLLGAVVAEERPLTTTDILADERFRSTYSDGLRGRIAEAGHRAMLAVPLRAKARIIGVLYVASLEERVFTPAEAGLLQAFGDQAALALENARLYAEATRRLDKTRALLEVAEILNSTLDDRQTFERVVMKIAQVCGVDRCSIERRDDEGIVPLVSQFADGRPQPETWAAYIATRTAGAREIPAHARAIETRRPVVIDDAERTDLIPHDWIAASGLASSMVVPLIRQDRVIGVMSLDHCERATPFAPWQIDLATTIAGPLALSLENSRLYAEARERLWETTTLVAVSQALSQSGSTVEIMRRAAREVTRAFGADMTGMYAFDPSRQTLVPLAGYHVPRDLVEDFLQRGIPLTHFPKLLPAWREGRAIWSRDTAHDPRFEGEWVGALPPHGVLFAAALSGGEPAGGVFIVWWGTDREVRPAEIRLVESIAAQVGLAFGNLELTRRTELKLRETETLLSVSRALSTTLDRDALLRHFLRRLAAVIDADSVGIWTVDESGEWLVPLAGYHVPPEHLRELRGMRIPLTRGDFYAEATRTKRPLFSRDVVTDPRMPSGLRALLPHRSHLFVPIVVKDRMIGGLAAVWWNRVREFSQSELALTEAIANQVGVTLENLRLFEENRQRVNELSVLYDLSRAVTGQLDQDALVDAIEAQVARVLDVRNLVLVLRGSAANEPATVYTTVHGHRRRETLPEEGPHPLGLLSVVLETGQPLRTHDYFGECARRGVQPLARDLPARSVLMAPV